MLLRRHWCDLSFRLDAAHQAVVALDSVDSLHTIDSAKLCQAASNASASGMQLEDAYQAIQILSRLRLGSKLAHVCPMCHPNLAKMLICRCLDAKISSAAAEVAIHHLATADNVLAAFHSINVLSTLHQGKTLSQRIQAPQIERIIHLFKDLSSSQGTFKLSTSSPKRSILATGLVYRTLADARALAVSLSDETEGVVEEIRASLAQARAVLPHLATLTARIHSASPLAAFCHPAAPTQKLLGHMLC